MPVSKKKQNRIGATVAAVLAVLIVIFSIAGLNFRSSSLIVPIDSIFIDLTGYFQKGISDPLRWFGELWDSYLDLRDVKQENRALHMEVARLRQEVVRYREAVIENEQLRRLLKIREKVEGRVLVASVVAADIDAWASTVTVDKGRADGVGRDMVVLAAEGLAGRVIKSGLHFSRVIFISDYNSAVAVMIQRNHTRGILRGDGRGGCTIEYIEKGLDVKPGDHVITSGTDMIFPRGLLVGRVASVKDSEDNSLFQAITVKPAVNFRSLEKVIIMVTEKPLIEQSK